MFPTDSHPSIDYPAAAVNTSQSPAALDFIKFLTTPDARKIRTRYGFEVK
jgi:ABC-type molybdate transport system substrate-binding protein